MDTIVAPITAFVNSPVIVVRISGDNALNITNLLRTSKGNTPSTLTHSKVSRYSFLLNDGLEDDVLVSYFKNPNSFTGEDVVEISFHGNPIIVKHALQSMYNLGFRPAEAGEFSKRAFLNGKMDLTQAEAIQELIAAKTAKGVNLAYKQLTGRVRHEFDILLDDFLSLKANIEARIDFPDEDGAGDDSVDYLLSSIADIKSKINLLIAGYNSMRKNVEGLKLVLAGKPNVGKSSLLNILLRRERAIVSATAGTTRDYIAEDLFLSDIPITLYDTAGVRVSSDDIESSGVERSIDLINDADIVLVVLDLSKQLDSDDDKILSLTKDINRIVIGNKCDLDINNKYDVDIKVSAKSSDNIKALSEMIKDKAGMNDFDVNATTATVTERHVALLNDVLSLIDELMFHVKQSPLDMIAIDVESCINLIQEITGEVYTEKVLDIIFEKFCIGK